MSGRNAAFGLFQDPYVGFRFLVDIQGVIAGGFQEVSGLSAEMSTEDYQEGGMNDFVHKLPKTVKYGDIVLKKGLLDFNMLGAWYQSIVMGAPIVRMSGSIRILNSKRLPTYSWDFFEAYPIKWEASGVSASNSGIITESITLTHHGIKGIGIPL